MNHWFVKKEAGNQIINPLLFSNPNEPSLCWYVSPKRLKYALFLSHAPWIS